MKNFADFPILRRKQGEQMVCLHPPPTKMLPSLATALSFPPSATPNRTQNTEVLASTHGFYTQQNNGHRKCDECET